ncbi:MAG: hypothetical protein ABIL58_08715 [Pseudomonadota bacterium]
MTKDNGKDLSSSLLWNLFAPIEEITEHNAEAVIDWLKDRSSVLIWFTSIITGSLMLFTLFGKKPGFHDLNSIALSISLLLMFVSILCNLICVWQIPKWKLAIRIGRISNGRRMTFDLEISSWFGLVSFLGALVMAALGNSGL